MFSLFEPYLMKVKNPGSRVLISNWITLWYKNIFADLCNYYMYRGLFSFDIYENEPAYNYATVLVRPLEQSPTISSQQVCKFILWVSLQNYNRINAKLWYLYLIQFASFRKLLNHSNRPMVACGSVDFGQPHSEVYNINGPRIQNPVARWIILFPE